MSLHPHGHVTDSIRTRIARDRRAHAFHNQSEQNVMETYTGLIDIFTVCPMINVASLATIPMSMEMR